MKLDTLDALNDEELRALTSRANELLRAHDDERKAKAISDAKALKARMLADTKALLAQAGLSLKDMGAKKPRSGKAPAYHVGRQYRHPANKELTWNRRMTMRRRRRQSGSRRERVLRHCGVCRFNGLYPLKFVSAGITKPAFFEPFAGLRFITGHYFPGFGSADDGFYNELLHVILLPLNSRGAACVVWGLTLPVEERGGIAAAPRGSYLRPSFLGGIGLR
jgi:hypothetical protein